MRPEDLIWGLFMNKYIFSGADASLPLSDMCKYMEKAGFEIQSAENISIHYAITIQRWHKNWQANREQVLKTYGERWYRLWHLFLAWSWRIARAGQRGLLPDPREQEPRHVQPPHLHRPEPARAPGGRSARARPRRRSTRTATAVAEAE